MSQHEIFIKVVKGLATAAFFFLHYEFIPFGALGGLLTGLILYGIWCPFFKEL